MFTPISIQGPILVTYLAAYLSTYLDAYLRRYLAAYLGIYLTQYYNCQIITYLEIPIILDLIGLSNYSDMKHKNLDTPKRIHQIIALPKQFP